MELAHLLNDSIIYRRTKAGERALRSRTGTAARHARILAQASGYVDLRTLIDLASADDIDLLQIILELLHLGLIEEVPASRSCLDTPQQSAT